jgi:FKBP-type peptidyl-prolyl cis-trans isomerase 2
MNMKHVKNDINAAFSMAFIVLVAVLMVSASSVVILLYQGGQGEKSVEIQPAKWGDDVKVDYVGRLSDGRVFDTSIWSVASNDAMYPKSLNFQLREKSAYSPPEFEIGGGQMIRGFERGVIGLAVGETKVITILPADGYGPLNQTKLKSIQLVQSLPVFESMNISTFMAKFSVSPEMGLALVDPVWGWDASIFDLNYDADRVTVMNTPVLGSVYKVYGDPEAVPKTGWYAEIEYFDSSANGGVGMISVRHILDPQDGGRVKGIDPSGNEFIVMTVDSLSNSIVLNYNSEVTGVTLHFTVTLVEIVKV